MAEERSGAGKQIGISKLEYKMLALQVFEEGVTLGKEE
jgi:hypothetical protein